MEEKTLNKKYSEMSFEEFINEVLEIKLDTTQTHMVKMFEEVKSNKPVYMNPFIGDRKNTNADIFNPLTIYYNNKDGADRLNEVICAEINRKGVR